MKQKHTHASSSGNIKFTFNFPFLFFSDDTYMYDETTGTTYRLGPAPPHHPGQHWYDEPPYESDPDDFLMGGQYGPAATIQVRNFTKMTRNRIDL